MRFCVSANSRCSHCARRIYNPFERETRESWRADHAFSNQIQWFPSKCHLRRGNEQNPSYSRLHLRASNTLRSFDYRGYLSDWSDCYRKLSTVSQLFVDINKLPLKLPFSAIYNVQWINANVQFYINIKTKREKYWLIFWITIRKRRRARSRMRNERKIYHSLIVKQFKDQLCIIWNNTLPIYQ